MGEDRAIPEGGTTNGQSVVGVSLGQPHVRSVKLRIRTGVSTTQERKRRPEFMMFGYSISKHGRFNVSLSRSIFRGYPLTLSEPTSPVPFAALGDEEQHAALS